MDQPASRSGVILVHDGRSYLGEVATIESTRLCSKDGILTADLYLKGDSFGISVGDDLDTPDRVVEHLSELLRTVGVSSWEDLPGSSVVVLFATEDSWGRPAAGIAGVDNGRVYLTKAPTEPGVPDPTAARA